MEDPDSTPNMASAPVRTPTRADANSLAIAQDSAPSICRICRGESTQDEPLFYPCKCSGSIKYVHQDCLMEWLSHSQKKYCELCKTSFRFTKLYAPDMPQSLPVHVFIGHMAKYSLRNVLIWLRAAMAISVWVCWLPYIMRLAWYYMFWISDEGFVSGSLLARANKATNAAINLASSLDGTCPATPLLTPSTTSAAAAEAILTGMSGQNVSEFLISFFLGSLGMSLPFDEAASTPDLAANLTAMDATNSGTKPTSLLGNVTFLQRMTRNPTVNRTVVSVLEGQIITILVIVCFILVILVRDYVVQQQPEINMRAAFPPPDNVLEPEPRLVRPEDEVILPSPDDSDDETLDEGDKTASSTAEVASSQFYHPSNILEFQSDDFAVDTSEEAGSSSTSPSQLHATSNFVPSEERASVYDYLRIYRRADGVPERIIEIIQEEGLQEKLSYWLEVTRRAIPGSDNQPSDLASLVGPSEMNVRPESSSSTGESTSKIALTPVSNEGSQTSQPDGNTIANTKGKERAVDTDPQFEAWTSEPLSSPSRPRAVSDGPQRHNTVNPLANNSWSFAALPPELETAEARPEESDLHSRPSFIEHINNRAEEEELLGHDSIENSSWERNSNGTPENGSQGDQEPTALPVNGETNVAVQIDGALPDAERPHGIVGRVADFMWGDLEEHLHAQAEDALRDVAANVDDDAGWADMDDPDSDPENDELGAEDDEDDEAVPGAGLDPEAIEDLEDFEGVMELIGMRGPVAGLFQNAIFCAVLVFVTIFACILIPYNIGRVSVWILANPVRLIRLLFELSKLLQDAAVIFVGLTSWVALNLVDIFTSLLGGFIAATIVSARKASWVLWTNAGSRVFDYALMDFPMSASEMQNFSAVSHEALLAVKANIKAVFFMIADFFSAMSGGQFLPSGVSVDFLAETVKTAWESSLTVGAFLTNPSSWVIDLSESNTTALVDPNLASWDGMDRFWAILAGYITLFFVGAMYLKRGSPFSTNDMMQAWEGRIIDTLHQASGIMKVIMIISIEMLVFPLYCGLLLDGALLPLFEDTTFKSRILFTYNYPLTSVFVHWFVGTGYMFHFALFVSMCRKIMRQGVLYFIRDPDDPEFHPVRDVLERNLTTQLRKILFSAFVYGALVIVCLGGVVWGLSYAVPDVLPVHYSSNEPVLEFPVDLLFYNFLMPLAVNFFKPGDGLHAMYTWWFRTCARGLRLTFFLFGERRIDEEGRVQLTENSQYHELPSYRTWFLELDKNYRVIPKTFRDAFEGGDAKPQIQLPARTMASLHRKKARLVESGNIVASGRFVRAPASDRVKIPKGQKVFLDVNEHGHRIDGQPNTDLYASNQYQLVYIPPNFRARVFLFILFIWLFAAVTGVGFTIIPLMFGRRMFKLLIPEHIRTNDIYAFSIGVYVLGSLAYLAFHIKSVWQKMNDWVEAARDAVTANGAELRAMSMAWAAAKLMYAYFFLLVVFPLVISGLMELYLAIPLHTYLYPPTADSVLASRAGNSEASRHTVRVIQAWTLGLLYLKLSARTITGIFPNTRLAVAVRAVLRRGWLHPQVGILTRAFVLPGLVVTVAAVFGPPLATNTLINYGFITGAQGGANEAAEAARLAVVYRQSYPAMALVALLVKNTIGLVRVFDVWTSRIRDEAYLIGERLHNFGAAAAGARRVRGAWRAGGARL